MSSSGVISYSDIPTTPTPTPTYITQHSRLYHSCPPWITTCKEHILRSLNSILPGTWIRPTKTLATICPHLCGCHPGKNPHICHWD